MGGSDLVASRDCLVSKVTRSRIVNLKPNPWWTKQYKATAGASINEHKTTMKTRGSCGEEKDGKTKDSSQMRENREDELLRSIICRISSFPFVCTANMGLPCPHVRDQKDSDGDLTLVRNNDEVP